MMKNLFSLAIGLFAVFVLQAQDPAPVTVSPDRTPLLTLIEQLEKETTYKFFFLREWIDTVDVTVRAGNSSMEHTLREALAGTGINFLISKDKIILTPGIQLTDKVDSSFFSEVRSTDDIVSTRFLRESPREKSGPEKNALVDIGRRGSVQRRTYTLTGYIRDAKSGEALPGAVVYSKGSNDGVTTDAFGFYSLTLAPGIHTLTVQQVGMKTNSQQINLLGDGKFDFLLEESVTQLKEVIIESEVDVNVGNVQMGVSRIDLKSMKNIPKILGENDVLRVATSLPGVRTVGEGASGINVRGGHADQNLIMLNEATIYNPSHFLGFFSVFNPDAIRSFELYKSGIPVQFGGRLSSAFELLMRDGNQKKFSGQGGLGPITSHLTLEVPLVKDKTSLMVGGRTTYSNWVLRRLPETVLRNTSAAFYDVFARLTHSPNDKNSFYLSLYNSFDEFRLSTDTLFSYSNRLASFQWRHVFSPNTDALLSVTYSNYDYGISYKTVPAEAFDMGFSVGESNVKYEINHSRGRHRITGGLQAKLYDLDPGFVRKGSDSSAVKVRKVDDERGFESALFVADNIEITPNLSLYVGMRYSHFTALGPGTVFNYLPGQPRSEKSISDSVYYGSNKIITTFHGPEYRASLRYKINDATSLKASFNRTRQYIHMLSNTVSVSPTDTWKLSDPNVKPQVADQASAGFYKNLRQEVYEFSAEAYYKWIENILDYKTGASLLVNEHIDQQILQGNGKAYGIELLLRKRSGKVTGWLGYSYSRTFVRLNGTNSSERINRGQYFPANYDKPHDVSLISNYKITRRYSLSFNFAYSTGRPITYPVAAYRFGNTYRVNYSERNASRIPDYIRADIGFNIEGNHRIRKLAHSYWSISVYNILGRKNPYSVYFKVEGENIQAYKLSIFGVPIPTVTYHFKF
jgi:hypothetical protein